MIYRNFGKRYFDLAVSILLIIVFSPVLAILALLVRVKLGSPVLFVQQRPGYLGEPFKIFKFRSMNDRRDAQGQLLPDEQRLTHFGKLLRSTSLDELPELVNVLRGEMSLVGPRPLLMQYLERYTAEQMKRHNVRPGITGWAQVNGRNGISWNERFILDVWYVNNVSLWLDIKILFQTLITVVQRRNISQPGKATIDEFRGGR